MNHNNTKKEKKFEILEKLKENENVFVYKILNNLDNKIYSLRKINLKGESKEELENIQNEVKIISNINSDYIIKYLNCFIKNDTFNIVTEYYEEINLRQFINKYKNEKKLIGRNLIYHIMKEISLGLKEIHNNNLIHGALIPENLFFTSDNKIKIGNFGIFSQLNNYHEYISTKNDIDNYLPPEIIKGEQKNKKNDIWSLGCILYELCTLDYCFKCNNIIGLYNKIINKNHGKINLKVFEPELQELIDSLLQKDSQERPNIKEICKLVLRNCDNNEEKKYEKKYEKSKIKLIIEIKEDDINKEIYFLDNTDYEDQNGDIHFHDSLKEFDESNVKLYINNKKYRYQKCFRFTEKGEYKIKLKFYFPLKDCSNMFYNCKAIKSIDLSSFNTKNITNMSNMFYNCENLIFINFSNFNTENVINMKNMFKQCYSLTTITLNMFVTNKVNNMHGMFHSCDKLINLDLSNFDTQNVTDMSNMFAYCNSLEKINLSHFHTENLKNMSAMFYMCENLKNLDLSNFNTKNVTNMSEMFCYCQNLRDINLSSFETQNVITMEKMFYNCYNIRDIDLSKFELEKASNISRMFCECKNLENLNISLFNMKNVNNYFQIFYNCKKLKEIIVKKDMDISIIEKEIKDNNINPKIIFI